MNYKIAVLAPHYDDAVLSCADHILGWLADSEVTVITFFSHVGNSTKLPVYSKHVLSMCGYTALGYQKQRAREDRAALSLLGCHQRALEYIDAGFRVTNGSANYVDASDLFSGTVARNDQSLVPQLEQEVAKIVDRYDRLYVPLALGSHIDHLLINQAAKRVATGRNKLYFYFDAPYFFQRKNWWSTGAAMAVYLPHLSMRIMTNKKRAALACYETQLKLLFSDHAVTRYPEFVTSRGW